MSVATITETVNTAAADVLRAYGSTASAPVAQVISALEERDAALVTGLTEGGLRLGASLSQIEALLTEVGLIQPEPEVEEAPVPSSLDEVVSALASLTATVQGLVAAQR